MTAFETYTMENVSIDGRRVRIERTESAFPDAAGATFVHNADVRLYIDDELVDASGLAYSHDLNGRMVLHTSVGDLTLSKAPRETA